MRADKNGIELTKAELTAAIAATQLAGKKVNGVAFETAFATVRMYASDGTIAVQATGTNDGFRDGRWKVKTEFLERLKKAMESKEVARLCFRGASLHQATILTPLEGEDGKVSEVSQEIARPTDAVDHQEEFPFDLLAQGFRQSNDLGVPAPIWPRYYELLALVGKCGIRAFERCPGRSRMSPVIDSATSSNGTDWCCMSIPAQDEGVERPGDRKRMHDVRQRYLWDEPDDDSPLNNVENETKVSMTTMDGEVIELGTARGVREKMEEIANDTAPPAHPKRSKKAPKASSTPKRRKGVRSPEEVEQEANQ